MAVPEDLEQRDERDVVVVVEDDPTYLRALVMTIERSDLDVEVVQATNGVDGLLEIGRVQPSLVLLDYGLPDLNAVQVLQRLLEPGRRLNAEVIVMTAWLPEEAGAELRKVGVKTIVNKAEGMSAVVDAMRQALRRQVAA